MAGQLAEDRMAGQLAQGQLAGPTGSMAGQLAKN